MADSTSSRKYSTGDSLRNFASVIVLRLEPQRSSRLQRLFRQKICEFARDYTGFQRVGQSAIVAPTRAVCEAEEMSCPACGQRKARRHCPALGQTICPVCCGTKRQVEIRCPSDCGYLTSSREHPAAVVRRQQERDVATLLPTIRHLTERQYQLFFLFQMVVARHTPDGFTRLVDDDVAEAAGTLASTFETSTRGVIYEHTAQSTLAQALITAMNALVAQMRE